MNELAWRRVSASAHNCAAIIVGSLPLYPLLGRELYRVAAVGICFAYHAVFRNGCLGNYLAGLRNEPPLTLLYCALYSAGFTTIFVSVFVPFDVLALYILAQLACLRCTGRTIPGYLTNWSPTDDARSTTNSLESIGLG
jgi:hypothetical protein